MSEETKADEPVHATPNVREPAKTQTANLQGGPMHGRIIRVQIDHETVVMDGGSKNGPLTYRRSPLAACTGAIFDYVPPEQSTEAPAIEAT